MFFLFFPLYCSSAFLCGHPSKNFIPQKNALSTVHMTRNLNLEKQHPVGKDAEAHCRHEVSQRKQMRSIIKTHGEFCPEETARAPPTMT